MNSSKYYKDNGCRASQSDGVDLAGDTRSSKGFPIRNVDDERVAS